MPAGASLALARIRVARGEGRPSDEQFRAALAADRERLHQSALAGAGEMQCAGPYAISVDGAELDEWVAWER